MYQYMEVVISVQGKEHGSVRFPLGEGNAKYYVHRAVIFARPYLPAATRDSDITCTVHLISSKTERLVNTYVPILS